MEVGNFFGPQTKSSVLLSRVQRLTPNRRFIASGWVVKLYSTFPETKTEDHEKMLV